VNLLVIIFIAFALWRALKGFKNGFAKEVNSLVSLFMALVVLSMALLLFASVMQKNTKTTIISIVLLVVVSMLYRLISVLMKSLETIAKLPVINLINKLLGMAAGALEVLAVFWILYVIIGSFPTGQFGEKVMEWTHQSTILINVYNKNYIANWIATL
jgi:uncharacterized membrane protein required for colicin V production